MQRRIFLIAAIADNGVIGKDNKLPWHYSADLKKFKELTTGNTVIMGRKTFESIGKPLPNRDNFVLSSAEPPANLPKNMRWFKSLEDAIDASGERVFIIGGERVYREAIEKEVACGLYLTHIHENHEGDAFFPELPEYFEPEKTECLQETPRIELVYYENMNFKSGTSV